MSENKIDKIREEVLILLKGLSFSEVEELLYSIKKEVKDRSTF